jgi:hypothetical protein
MNDMPHDMYLGCGGHAPTFDMNIGFNPLVFRHRNPINVLSPTYPVIQPTNPNVVVAESPLPYQSAVVEPLPIPHAFEFDDRLSNQDHGFSRPKPSAVQSPSPNQQENTIENSNGHSTVRSCVIQ